MPGRQGTRRAEARHREEERHGDIFPAQRRRNDLERSGDVGRKRVDDELKGRGLEDDVVVARVRNAESRDCGMEDTEARDVLRVDDGAGRDRRGHVAALACWADASRTGAALCHDPGQ
jgi:hypothetical protein